MEILYVSKFIKVLVGVIEVGEVEDKDDETCLLVDKEDNSYKFPVSKDIINKIEIGEKLICIYQYQEKQNILSEPLFLMKYRNDLVLFTASYKWNIYFNNVKKDVMLNKEVIS